MKTALKNLLKEGGIGLVLTGLMILLFLGSPRATFAVLLSIPLSALACLLVINGMGGSINTMLLGGLALAFSRLIDNSVVVLENIFRFMEQGSTATGGGGERRNGDRAGGAGGNLHNVDCVFPGDAFLRSEPLSVHGSGVGSGAVDLCFVCFCADGGAVVLRAVHPDGEARRRSGERDTREGPSVEGGASVQCEYFQKLLGYYEGYVKRALVKPGRTAVYILGGIVLAVALIFPFVGRAYFPRTDPGQFVINR